jgi:hypothetical protein
MRIDNTGKTAKPLFLAVFAGDTIDFAVYGDINLAHDRLALQRRFKPRDGLIKLPANIAGSGRNLGIFDLQRRKFALQACVCSVVSRRIFG